MIKVCITRKVFDAAAPECFGDVGAILETELHRNVHDAVVQISVTPGGRRFSRAEPTRESAWPSKRVSPVCARHRSSMKTLRSHTQTHDCTGAGTAGVDQTVGRA
jgi:hypothetical protein